MTINVRRRVPISLVLCALFAAFGCGCSGHGPCGTDTCNAWMTPGDLLLLGRVGVGYAF